MDFAELVALIVVGSGGRDTVAGVVRHESPEDEAWTHRVWRRGDRVRIESPDRQVLRIVGADLEWGRDHDDVLVVRPRGRTWGSPIGGLEPGGDRGSFSRWDGTDFTRPTGPVERTVFLGRDCWLVELAPPRHKPYPLQVTVDAATGLVLRSANRDFGSVTEFTEVEIGADLPDALFVWDGPARPEEEVRAERDAAHERDMALRAAWLDARGVVLDLPVVPDVLLHDWSDDTGAFEASFDTHASGSLVRRPRSDLSWDVADRMNWEHAYRWSDGRWDWLLATTVPIDDEQLALLKVRLAAST